MRIAQLTRLELRHTCPEIVLVSHPWLLVRKLRIAQLTRAKSGQLAPIGRSSLCSQPVTLPPLIPLWGALLWLGSLGYARRRHAQAGTPPWLRNVPNRAQSRASMNQSRKWIIIPVHRVSWLVFCTAEKYWRSRQLRAKAFCWEAKLFTLQRVYMNIEYFQGKHAIKNPKVMQQNCILSHSGRDHGWGKLI